MIVEHNRRRTCMIVFMAKISVAEAAKQLGVGLSRVHRRIAAGSLRAERIGSQWVVDELSVLNVAERKEPGRPLSARSAWAIIALEVGDDQALARLAPVERSRAQSRLDELLALANSAAHSEGEVRQISSTLRRMFQNRANLVLRKGASADLPLIGADFRWESRISPVVSSIANVEVNGYLAAESVDALCADYLLLPAEDDANVVIHVLPDGQQAYPKSRLQLAADLADLRGPREELRAAELVGEVAGERRAVRR